MDVVGGPAELEAVDPLRAKLDDIDELDNASAVPALKTVIADGKDTAVSV